MKREAIEGEWRAEWDDDARILRRWRNMELVEERPYTDEEIAALVAADEQREADARRAALVEAALVAPAANDAEQGESEAVAARAQELASSPVTDLPTDQIVSVLKELASGIGVLAAHDVTAKRELTELIKLVVGD